MDLAIGRHHPADFSAKRRSGKRTPSPRSYSHTWRAEPTSAKRSKIVSSTPRTASSGMQQHLTVGLLGLKGTMSAGLTAHVAGARIQGGIRNKAARGELRRGLPAGLV